MEKLEPIYLGYKMYLEPDLVRFSLLFDGWGFDYYGIELNKLNEMD